jgi:hypothetical protein
VRRALLALLVAGCTSSDGGKPAVVISELMYHPVDEPGPAEVHEFVEVHNAGSQAVDLGGWKLSGGIRFTFAPGTSLGAGRFLVVPKDRNQLLALGRYALSPAAVLGNYQGELDNDGETVVLENGRGEPVDQVTYRDQLPWPVAADALGASADWLTPDRLGNQPAAAHRFLGRSLERLSMELPGSLAANWDVSPLDGATPGRPNSGRGARAVVESLKVGDGTTIAADEPVTLQVRFSEGEGVTPIADPQVELFVDDLDREDEALTTVPLVVKPGGTLEASLPPQKEGSIVRYRVVGDRGQGKQVISPQPSDPFEWHATFVSPAIAGKTVPYQLFIGKSNWELLWDYIQAGRVTGNIGTLGGKPGLCEPNPFWDAKVPAVLVVGGKVYDVQARYQGSASNRPGAARPIDPRAWPMGVKTAARPNPLWPLSWHFTFPRYNRLEGKKSINVNKLTDSACQGFAYTVATRLFEQAGIPAGGETHYLRLFVNGAYYNYAQRIEHKDEEMLRRFYGKGHPLGDLFKADGARWEQGPYGWSDERLLEDNCGYTAAERYDTTYPRVTPDWKQGSVEIKALIEALHKARAGGVPAMRAFFTETFDLDALTTYVAIRNWMAPWDDYFHNHFLYRRTDGRWILIPDDFDSEIGNGPFSGADTSFFNGRENDRSNRNNWMNYLKDAYLRAFRPELEARLRDLTGSVLHPANVAALVDEAVAGYEADEARQAPSVVMLTQAPICSLKDDPKVTAARMKGFALARAERILDGLFD